MARGARGVTCRECGCLNFSPEREVCDKCHCKALKFRPTARRIAVSSGVLTYRRNEDAGPRAHSLGKKRRYNETGNASNKDAEDRDVPKKPTPVAKKQPDVIDLVSDDEEDDEVEVQSVTRASIKTMKREEKEEEKEPRGLFQSRLLPTATFVASDFPSMEEGTQMKMKAAVKGIVGAFSQSTGGEAGVMARTSAQEETAASTSRVAEKTVDPKPAELKPLPVVVEDDKKEEKKKVTGTSDKEKEEKEEGPQSTKKQGDNNTAPAPAPASAPSTVTASTAARNGEEDADQAELKVKTIEEEDPLFQSRVLDWIEFKASDFVTVFDGLAVARRSHPPSSSTFNAAISMSVGLSATTTMKSVGFTKPNEVTGPAEAATIAPPSTTSATSKTTATSSTTESAAPKASTTAATDTSTSSAKSQSVAKTPSSSAVTAVRHVAAKSIPKFAAISPPSTEAASTPGQTSSTPSAVVTLGVMATAPTTSSVTSTPVPVSTTMKPRETTKPASSSTATTPVPATVTDSGSTKAPSAPASNPDKTQAPNSTNVLLPKKKHFEGVQRTHEEKRHTKPPPIDVNSSTDADGFEFVKVNAAPREILPVEPPNLGYCSPDFLTFMRECGDEDGEEEEDPEEMSRSQLKLLDVVDLTSLSDSEDSDAESPSPRPRDGASQQNLPANGLTAATTDQSSDVPNVNVSGTGTWFVPTLDSERKRTQPEKVTCELCEEKGALYRLIRCPTCTKYYHKKCAKENGDENICWNCELGSMIDDSELDAEHAKHNSEYLAYLKAIRRSSSPEDGEDESEQEGGEKEEQEDENAIGEDDVEMAGPTEGEEDSKSFLEGNSISKAGKRWMEFIGGATADIDASYHEVTNRIAQELRDEEKRRLYSRGFVSREEFEAQMTQVEEYYISEEARLQQLEREKVLEAKKAAEARKAQAETEQAANGDQPPDTSASGNNALVPTPVTGCVAKNQLSPSSASSTTTTDSVVNGTTTVIAAPVVVPEVVDTTPLDPATHTAARTAIPASTFLSKGLPATAIAAAAPATFSGSPPSPPSRP